MIRLSDARMSGTAFGTIILHITPEAWIGGPLAMVQNGDRIRLGTKQRQLALLVDEFTLAARHKAWIPPPAHPNSARGYKKRLLLYNRYC